MGLHVWILTLQKNQVQGVNGTMHLTPNHMYTNTGCKWDRGFDPKIDSSTGCKWDHVFDPKTDSGVNGTMDFVV